MDGGYQRLEVYTAAHALAIEIHSLTLSLPSFERYEEGSQIRRSSQSVTANIVEGYALRRYKNEYLHYLYRAYGSAEETLEHLRYLAETRSLSDELLYERLAADCRRVNGMLYRFIQGVERHHIVPGASS